MRKVPKEKDPYLPESAVSARTRCLPGALLGKGVSGNETWGDGARLGVLGRLRHFYLLFILFLLIILLNIFINYLFLYLYKNLYLSIFIFIFLLNIYFY